MRISDNMNYAHIRKSIERSKELMDKASLAATTLKKVNTLSDDPAGVIKVLELNTTHKNQVQFITNGRYAQSFLEATDAALSDLADVIIRLKELALSQSSSPNQSPHVSQGVAQEVAQLFDLSVMIGNRKLVDRYLFSGYKINHPAVESNTGKYLGDEGETFVEVAQNAYLAINLPGSDVFFFYPDKDLPTPQQPLPHNPQETSIFELSLYDTIQDFYNHLMTSDIENIRNSIEKFDHLHAKLIALRAKVGSRMNGLESANQHIEKDVINQKQLSSQIEDADLTQVLSDLSKQEAIYKNALMSSKRLIHPNLLDHLR